uniref:NADH dehydrogenase subunit 2 n=1 Tax=Eunotia naegelii TaxID=1458866 RepID=A0A2U9GHY7_9STRA|nr:NADH dehydrogenase subunit 2 [Eunotia naegelii]AWQ64089.1 NADH dehydrogenase subunit 2 [Eunotia naegelii]
MINNFEEDLCYKFFIPFRIIDDLSIFENNESLRSQISLFFDWSLVENSIFNISLNELSLIPEFFLAFTAVTIITHCSLIAYNKKYNSVLLQFSVTSLCMLIVFLTLLLYLHEGSITVKHLSFEFSFLSDSLGFLAKIITIIASLFCMYLLQDYIIEYKINSTEYDLLMLYAILGLTMLITANDFGTIFLALELQSLSLYMLAGFKKNSIYSIESGLKYFILGALSAAYFLLGWSLLYGISGLFVLLGFHFFFFNIFSDVNSEVEKSVIEYKTSNNTQSNSSESIENSLTPFNNIFLDITNDLDDAGILLSFNNNFKIILKLAEFLCCDCCNNMPISISKNEPLSIEDEILKLYDSQKTKINYEEYQSIHCAFCRNYLESFKIIDENQVYGYKKENLKLEIEKKLYENKQIMQQPDNFEKKCWFCETLIENYKKAINEEERRIKIKTKKMINIYETGLSTEAFAYHYNFLETYFSKRNELTLNKFYKDLLINELFKTCDTAVDLGKYNVPVCQNIINRFNQAWEIEGLRSSILSNKIKKTCEKLKSTGRHNKICEAIKRLTLFENVEDASSYLSTNKIINLLINENFLDSITNCKEDEINIINEINKVDQGFLAKEFSEVSIRSLGFQTIVNEKKLKKKILVYSKIKNFCFEKKTQNNNASIAISESTLNQEKTFEYNDKITKQSNIDFIRHMKKVNAAQRCKIATLNIENFLFDEAIEKKKSSLNLTEQMCEALKQTDETICPVCEVIQKLIEKTFKMLENKKNESSYALLPYYELTDKMIIDLKNQLNQKIENQHNIIEKKHFKNPLLTELFDILKRIDYDKDLIVLVVQDIATACQEKVNKNDADLSFCNEIVKELQEYWRHIYYYKQITEFNELEKKTLSSTLDKELNNQVYTGYNISSENKEKIELNIKKKEIEIKTKKISYNKKSANKTNQSRLAESSLTLILISFFFKLAVAPFHLWSLDIYEGSLTSSTVFFAVVTKFSVIVILIKICYYGFYSLLKSSLYQSLIIASASSILVGSIAGLTERKLKSLLAYSSINNIGYILLALTIGTLNGIKTTVFYLIIYISSSLATWSGLVSIQLQKNRYMKKQNKEFGDIVMLRKTNPILTLTLQIALFSTAGLPPFIGFLTKMNVFITSIESHIFLVSLITILLSIISTFYYLRLVKITCFEKILVGKLYKPMKIKQSTVNTIFSFFLPYQFFKPWLSIFFSYKVVIC